MNYQNNEPNNGRLKKRVLSSGIEPTTAKVAVIGKVKIGEKNAKGYPTSLDYFKFDSTPQYCSMIADKYGEKPTLIKIFFPSNDLKEICNHEYTIRDTSGKKAAYGDGENFYVAKVQPDKQVKFIYASNEEILKHYGTVEAFMAKMEERLSTKWKEWLTLRFMIVGFPVLACWQFESGGDDTTIPAIVQEVDRLMSGAGRVAQIPFDLSVKKVKSDKSGSTNSYPVVSLVCNFSPEDVDNLKQLPQTVSCFGLLTSEKVRNFANTLPPPSESNEHADYEIIE